MITLNYIATVIKSEEKKEKCQLVQKYHKWIGGNNGKKRMDKSDYERIKAGNAAGTSNYIPIRCKSC